MRRPVLTLRYLVLFAALSSGCADLTSKQGHSIMAPGPSFSLSEADRADLKSGLDQEALERLLARIPPHHQAQILSTFKRGVRGGIVRFGNPELDALLREVWAPVTGGGPLFSNGPRERRRVDLVLVPRLLQDPQVGAMVIRDGPGGWERIVIPEAHATPAQMFQAHGALSGDQRRYGMFPATERRFIVKHYPLPDDRGNPQIQATLRMLEEMWGKTVQDLRRAPFQELPGFGRARVLVLHPGSQARP